MEVKGHLPQAELKRLERVEKDADLQSGVRQLGERLPVDQGAARRRDGQADHDAHRGGFSGAIFANQSMNFTRKNI